MIKIKFEIEFILERKGYLLAKILEKKIINFKLNNDSTLNNFPVEPVLSMPRALDELGNPRVDLFAFKLKKKKDINYLKTGMVVELFAEIVKEK